MPIVQTSLRFRVLLVTLAAPTTLVRRLISSLNLSGRFVQQIRRQDSDSWVFGAHARMSWEEDSNASLFAL